MTRSEARRIKLGDIVKYYKVYKVAKAAWNVLKHTPPPWPPTPANLARWLAQKVALKAAAKAAWEAAKYKLARYLMIWLCVNARDAAEEQIRY